MAAAAPFPIQPDLTAIALMYRNKALIADDVLPRVPVGKQSFKYFKHTMADSFTVPDTQVGRRSPPNQVEFTGSEVTDSTNDHALDDSIPNADIENFGGMPGPGPVEKATMLLSNLLALDREVRASSLVFATGSYAAGNQTTLSGTSQWSDYTNSNPASAILTALDSMIMRPNILVLGRAVWTALSQHPKLVQAIYKTAQNSGIVARQQVADLLELDAIYVGEGWLNTAHKGQTATMARVWGKHAALLYRDSLASASSGTTFGFTAQFGGRVGGSIEDKDIGMRGGVRVRVGESVKELITANDLGYFFQNAVA